VTLPTALTPLGVAAAVWGAVVGVPAGGAAAAAVLLGDYGLWLARGRPWHDWAVILPLLVPIGIAVWVVWEHRLPGIGLLGISCVLISYHGRHHPLEGAA
jgi:hypothetical protein